MWGMHNNGYNSMRRIFLTGNPTFLVSSFYGGIILRIFPQHTPNLRVNKYKMIKQRRFWSTAIIAWIVFIGIDFFFHASLLESLWQEEIEAIKPATDLFILIPIGYLSFLLLTLLVGYSFTKIYQSKPSRKEVTIFSLIFGLLYSGSNFLALFSYVDIPLKQLLIYNLVYFLEILAIVFIFYKTLYKTKIKKMVWYSILTFFVLIVLGITFQNIR